MQQTNAKIGESAINQNEAEPLAGRRTILAFLFWFVIFSLLLTEAALRIRHGFDDVESQSVVRNALYWWDSAQSVSPLVLNSGASTNIVYFVGDSFVQEKKWPVLTQQMLAKRGIKIDGYNLGVAGFGTVQEYLKVRQTFELYRPTIVCLLFFAWNDPRDNINHPPIYYSFETRHRPYLSGSGDYLKVIPPSSSTWVEGLQIYRTGFLPIESAVDHVIVRLGGTELLAELAPWVEIPFSLEGSWVPFYEPSGPPVPYRERAWAATEDALVAMEEFLDEHHSRLVVLGLDNALTVDADVYDRYMRRYGRKVDVREPLRRLQQIVGRHHIVYINCLPALQTLSRGLRRKIYLGNPGSLSGHLTPRGEETLAQLASSAIEQEIAQRELAGISDTRHPSRLNSPVQ